ncbi:hypothetical protein BDY19DRAFT_1059658 [Irpex rosettiformis]|uniref:Uncharacterized protein n=1 Tax=Irpex rosettiformis TaxID=378272 RepID=A0ACB8TTD1_9APHY|nr:hypothetical protein BDY19DRAFT_1059658 [Irpex rosettiformis]
MSIRPLPVTSVPAYHCSVISESDIFEQLDEHSKEVLRSKRAVIFPEEEFFHRLTCDYRLLKLNPNVEWVHYAPTASIFSVFAQTFIFPGGYVRYTPQPAFRAGSSTTAAPRPRTYRAPDSAGVLIKTTKDLKKNFELLWWCEEKPIELSFAMSLRSTSFQQREVVKQMNTQAAYAFIDYFTKGSGAAAADGLDTSNDNHDSRPLPDNVPRPEKQADCGIYAFLITGDHFTLFHYVRPANWEVLHAEELAKDKFRPESLASYIKPEVVMFNEQILDNAGTSFSPQMFYAFELLRRAINPTYTQPSYFHPHVDLDVKADIPLKSKQPIEETIELVASAEDQCDEILNSPVSVGDSEGSLYIPTSKSRNPCSFSPPGTRSTSRLKKLQTNMNLEPAEHQHTALPSPSQAQAGTSGNVQEQTTESEDDAVGSRDLDLDEVLIPKLQGITLSSGGSNVKA